MRKRLLSILALAVLVTSTLVGCSGASPTDSTLTIFSITEGTVLVMKAGTDDWTEAAIEMSLEVGDIIKTGDDSGAEITFFDGSTIELEAGTQIEITSLDTSPDTGTKTITLMQTIGTTISRVTKLLDPASSYAVETPTGVAAVRGSVMIVRIVFDDPNYEDGTVLITCVEGDISTVWNGVEVQVPEGYTCVIRPDGLLELIPPNEPPQEETGDVTDEDTTDEQSEEPQPGGSTNGSLPEPPTPPPNIEDLLDDIDLPDLFPPPTDGQNDQNGGSQNGGGQEGGDQQDGDQQGGDQQGGDQQDGDQQGGDQQGGDQQGGETTGTIHVITPADAAPIFIQVETPEGEKEWAIDLGTNLAVDGTKNFGVSDVITVAAGPDYHYYVWVGGDVYKVDNSHGWTVSDAPDPYGEQADGSLTSGEQQNLKFEVAGNGTGNN